MLKRYRDFVEKQVELLSTRKSYLERDLRAAYSMGDISENAAVSAVAADIANVDIDINRNIAHLVQIDKERENVANMEISDMCIPGVLVTFDIECEDGEWITQEFHYSENVEAINYNLLSTKSSVGRSILRQKPGFEFISSIGKKVRIMKVRQIPNGIYYN